MADDQQTDAEQPSWWTRPGGYREVLTVALPLVVSSLSWTVMTFVDRVLLQWDSGEAMSASFAGGVVWFAACCLPLGICSYANTFVSQYHGAGRQREIGPAVWQGVWVAVASAPFLVALAPLAPWVFALAEHGSEVARQEIVYFQILCWGSPAMLAAAALASFYSGRGRTAVVMVVDTLSVVLNLVLDWILIFGWEEAGIPALGIVGAAWATVIALWFKAAVYAALVLRPKYHQEFGTLDGVRLDRRLFSRLVYFGGPSGLQMLLDVLGFTVFVLLIGRLGPIETEATTMAFSVSSLAFMPVWGVGLAVSILVGQHLGENRDAAAARSTWTGLSLGCGYMAAISLLYVATPDLLLSSFFPDPAERTPHAQSVYALAVTLLRFVAAYNLGDAMVMIFANALKGAGDTQFILVLSLLMAIALGGVSWLAVEHWRLGVMGCWTVITIWLWAMAVAFLLRFRGGRWRSMRVIEPEVEK